MSGMSCFQTTPAALEICIAISRAALTSPSVAPFLIALFKCHLICRGESIAMSADIIAKDVSAGDVTIMGAYA